MATTNVPSCYVLIRDDDKALFVLRTNTGFMDNTYALPSGHVEDMESFREAAVREALEEVGLKIELEDLAHIHTMHRRAQEKDHVRVDVFFETYKWKGDPINAEPDKHAGPVWIDINDLPPNVMDYTAFALKNIAQGRVYSEFGWLS